MSKSDNACKKARTKFRGRKSKGQRASSMRTRGFDGPFLRSTKTVRPGWTDEERISLLREYAQWQLDHAARATQG